MGGNTRKGLGAYRGQSRVSPSKIHRQTDLDL